jgi:hypothetical protein
MWYFQNFGSPNGIVLHILFMDLLITLLSNPALAQKIIYLHLMPIASFTASFLQAMFTPIGVNVLNFFS